MKRTMAVLLPLFVIAACAWGGGGPQGELRFVDADVRAVYRALFRHSNVSYTLSPTVQGRVTIDLTGESFEKALQRLNDETGAIYRIEGGVVNVSTQRDGWVGPNSDSVSVKVDPTHVFVLHGDRLVRLRKRNLSVERVADIDGKSLPFVDVNRRVDVRVRRSDLQEVLRDVLAPLGISYQIEPDVRGSVSLDARDVPLGQALARLLSQVGANYRVEGGTIKVFRGSGRIRIGSDPGPVSFLIFSPTALAEDGPFLYLVCGSELRRLRKSDLKVVDRIALPQ